MTSVSFVIAAVYPPSVSFTWSAFLRFQIPCNFIADCVAVTQSALFHEQMAEQLVRKLDAPERSRKNFVHIEMFLCPAAASSRQFVSKQILGHTMDESAIVNDRTSTAVCNTHRCLLLRCVSWHRFCGGPCSFKLFLFR